MYQKNVKKKADEAKKLKKKETDLKTGVKLEFRLIKKENWKKIRWNYSSNQSNSFGILKIVNGS